VLLGRRAQRVIAPMNATADKLRHELLASIPKADLQTCMKVLARIRERAENNDQHQEITRQPVASVFAEHNGQTKRGHSIARKKAVSRRDGGLK
jgi:hypothetical protein